MIEGRRLLAFTAFNICEQGFQKPATHESPKIGNPFDYIFDIRPHGLKHFRHRNRLVVRQFIFRIVPNYLYVMPFTGFCEAAYAIL